MSVGYFETTSDDLRSTRSTTASLSYRLSPRSQLFGDLTSSRFVELGGAAQDVTSFRTGMTFFF
jgi:hypothetical protein